MNTSTTLGFAIRAVRERLRKDHVRVRDMIGCRQSTVSRYEAGKLSQADGPAFASPIGGRTREGKPLLRPWCAGICAQMDPLDLADALRTFDSYLSTAGGSADLTCSGAARGRTLARFRRLSAQLVSEGREIEPALPLCLSYGSSTGQTASVEVLSARGCLSRS